MNHLLRVLAYLLRFGTVRIANLLRPPKNGMCTRQMFGGTQLLDLDRSITQRLLFLDAERFVPERALLRDLVGPGDHVVDVGANIGYYALLFRQLGGPDAHLTLIEPSEENLPELEATLEANAFSEYTLHRCAVGRESGTVRIKRGINSGVTGADADGYDVPVRRLAELCEGPVDLIKIDVEGFEPEVVSGALEMIDRTRPTIFLEVHPALIARYGSSTVETLAPLRERYDEFEVWRSIDLARGPLLRRLLARYGLAEPLFRIDDPARFVDTLEDTAHPETFWAVFHSQRSATAA